MLCLGHARQWVDWDGCWRTAQDVTGGIEGKLDSWTAARRRAGTLPEPRLRSV